MEDVIIDTAKLIMLHMEHLFWLLHKLEIPDEINVRAIRERLKLSRQDFANVLVLVSEQYYTGSRAIGYKMAKKKSNRAFHVNSKNVLQLMVNQCRLTSNSIIADIGSEQEYREYFYYEYNIGLNMFTSKKLPKYLGLIFGMFAFCIMGLIFYIGLAGMKGATGTSLYLTMAWVVTPITGLIFGILGYSLGIVIRAGKDPTYTERLSYPIAIIMIIVTLIIIVKTAIFIYTLPPG